MRRISAWILAFAVVAGVAAAAAAYAHTSPGLPPASSTPAAATSDVRQRPAPTPRVAHPVTKVRWAPCPAGTRLEGGTCVREVVHTVVLPAPPAPPAAPAAAPAPAARPTPAAAAAASATTPTTAVTPHRDGGRDEAERDGEHESEHEGGEDGAAQHAEHDD